MTEQTTAPLDLTALKEIANAANTGPWESKQGAISPGKKVVGPREARDIGRGPIVLMQPIFWDKRSAVNAEHIAAFDPPTVLALLDRVEAAEKAVAAVREVHKPERRYQLKGLEEGGSWDTPEQVLEAYEDGTDEDREVTYFEICKQCGRIEANQINLMEMQDEQWGYEASIYPCPTITALDGTR